MVHDGRSVKPISPAVNETEGAGEWLQGWVVCLFIATPG
jgi:hypothetical protein